MCKFFKWLSFWLMFIGALNWGLVGLFNFDLVAFLLGEKTLWSRLTYSLVGLSRAIRSPSTVTVRQSTRNSSANSAMCFLLKPSQLIVIGLSMVKLLYESIVRRTNQRRLIQLPSDIKENFAANTYQRKNQSTSRCQVFGGVVMSKERWSTSTAVIFKISRSICSGRI